MNNICLRNATLAVGESTTSSEIVIEGSIFGQTTTEISSAEQTEIDVSGLKVFPGFIDIHIHGAIGADVNTADVDGLIDIALFLAQNGVTAWMPTLVPDSDENYRRTIDAIDELMLRQVDQPISQAVGVHYEGVFANEQMCGALRPEFFKKFSGREVGELPRLKQGAHMTTLAPEIECGIELIEELVRQNWVVSIGHTHANTETLDKALAAGAKHMTHFFNAMTGIHHREIGVAGWGLANSDVTFDIIADGIHVHPQMVALACHAKSPENVSLISDSVAPTGLGDGEYELWGEKVSVKNGRTQNERGSIAGSVITMHDAVKRMLSIGFSDSEVAKMASSNPASLIGLGNSRGAVEVGKRADLVALDAEGNIKMTMIGGKVVGQ